MNNVKIEYNEMRYLFDPRLSLKAKGVMSLMVAYINKHNNEPNFRLQDVEDLFCDGKTAFKNAVAELKDKKYLVINKGSTKKNVLESWGLYYTFTFFE